MPSPSEANLGLLDYEIARDAGTSGLKKFRINCQTYSPNERYNIGKHDQSSVQQVLYKGAKQNFYNLGRALFVRYVQSMRKNLKLR